MADTTTHQSGEAAAKAAADAAKKENEARQKEQNEQRAKMAKGTPTPTQEENDRAMLGEHVKLSDDGSGPDPHSTEAQKKK